MATIDYKEKYEAALERCKKLYNEAKANGYTSDIEDYETIFPELKESEERIRKALIKLVKKAGEGYENVIDGVSIENAISWLEAQGEQKPVDMVEPKFHEGDWITNGDYTWQIVRVTDLDYILQSQDGNIVDDTISHVDEQFHSFDIQDANDGDVLYSIDSKQPFIYKERPQFSQAIGYCCINKFGKFAIWNTSKCIICTDKYIPATKEQCDLLFAKMKEAGYEWDAEQKQLKKIEQSPAESINDAYPETLDKAIDLYYYSYGNGNGYFENLSFEKFKDIVNTFVSDYSKQKLAEWSEDRSKELSLSLQIQAYLKTASDELYAKGKPLYSQERLEDIHKCMLMWQKLHNAYFYQKPWSEEDEKLINSVIELIDDGALDRDEKDYFIGKLKSLRPNHWKPNDAQMENLSRAFNGGTFQTSLLMELYQDLKKLKS